MIAPLMVVALVALGAARDVAAQPAVLVHALPVAPRVETAAGCDAECLLQGARRALASREWARAAELYESALAGQAASAEHWRSFGEALCGDGRQREGVAAYERALQLGVDAPHRTAFDVARAYAQLGNRKQALRWIERAISLGLTDPSEIRGEPAFGAFHDDSRFEALVGSLQPAAAYRPVAADAR